jgi:choline dehydrogenase
MFPPCRHFSLTDDRAKVAEAAAFFRSSDPALFPQHTAAPPAHTEDSTHGHHAPDLEFFTSPFAYSEAGKGVLPETEMFGLHMVLLR